MVTIEDIMRTQREMNDDLSEIGRVLSLYHKRERASDWRERYKFVFSVMDFAKSHPWGYPYDVGHQISNLLHHTWKWRLSKAKKKLCQNV
jgi:hypothetical protein